MTKHYFEYMPCALGVKKLVSGFVIVILSFTTTDHLNAQVIYHDTTSILLRSGNEPEWEEFQNRKAKKEHVFNINIKTRGTHTLSLVQYDVRHNWQLFLNDRKIATLPVDGNAMRTYFVLPDSLVRKGFNTVKVSGDTSVSDDIIINDIAIAEMSPRELLSQGTIQLVVHEKNKAVPGRFTIIDKQRNLQSTGVAPQEHLAVRPGMIYTANGKATVSLPAGTYTIFAGRGFEYGIDSITVTLKKGDQLKHQFNINREVETGGWVSIDPHVHTLTYSGHGDATARERVVTLAGEGLDVGIITEHNKIIDYSPLAKQLLLDNYVKLLPGDEVTTSIGHFNVFPLRSNDNVPGASYTNWQQLSTGLKNYNSRLIILNHGRDIHHGFRPFEFLEKFPDSAKKQSWQFPANAMEIINSGALLSEPMVLINDWFNLLKAGYAVTPVGSSDSHDVGRYIVGQARTYVSIDQSSTGDINNDKLIENMKAGKVLVSYGLLTTIKINDKAGPGDTIHAGSLRIKTKVLGPSWIRAEKVSLYANGLKIKEALITDKNNAGVKWEGEWLIDSPDEETFYVAIASSGEPGKPFWPVVKPFQPVSTAWKPYAMGVSGAVWAWKRTEKEVLVIK